MINYSEENAVKLSATKKDFYQIWNELLETASKISERWDPTSTNESDPGIVLLKVLTAVADKLNYNIDVNALEAFMPSAAQEESMRKLTEMLGYNMKYYQSATTEALITYNLADSPEGQINDEVGYVCIDRFTNLKDIDDTVNYVTLRSVYLNKDTSSVLVPCIEGELVECETEDDNIISLLQLDDNNRYYLPETQIAENGIFVTNINNSIESDDWEKVYNLNTQKVNHKCYKFGFDSKVNLPYLQFPADINNIIEDGLKIKYLRTNGVNGNISPKTLYKMEKPSSWRIAANDENSDSAASNAPYFEADNYSVSNAAAAQDGRNMESITDAYNNYKKTIGTFDTLVTCRDYMNKIYQLTISDTSTNNLVSNIIVSDIRDDINKANTICTFGPYGIEYKSIAKKIDKAGAVPIEVSVWNNEYAGKEDVAEANLNKLFKVYEDTQANVLNYYRAVYDGNYYKFEAIETDEITHFDLVFYPFKPIYGLNSKAEYSKSFKYDDSNLLEIKEGIEENKTLSHNIITPNKDDIACIKNYFNLSAKVTTTRKVNYTEQKAILENIYSKLYENFNMRKVDFGEEIPYDDILRVMETADPRIKNVSLEDPTIETKFCTVEGGEFAYSVGDTSTTDDSQETGNYYYNKLALNNVLAGRIPLFNYDENFRPEYNESNYPAWGTGVADKYDLLYPAAINAEKTSGIRTIETEFSVDGGMTDVKLNPNEVIQFRLPNLRTTKTYPAYVNYFIKLNDTGAGVLAVPATMLTLADFLASKVSLTDPEDPEIYWDVAAANNAIKSSTEWQDDTEHITDQETLENEINAHLAIFTKEDDIYTRVTEYAEDTNYYYFPLTANTFGIWNNWLKTLTPVDTKLDGIYVSLGINLLYNYGKLVDNLHRKYKLADVWRAQTDPFRNYYVQATHLSTVLPSESVSVEDAYTKDGLGQDADPAGIDINEEYQLQEGEYLLINYTSSTSTEGSNKTVINECYRKGTIIKPNFSLINSNPDYRSLHNYSKTTGYNFNEYTGILNPPGMFTLGTNEQIEIREFVQVDLDKDYTNLYWERNDEVISANDRIYFEFEDELVYTSGNNKGQPVPAGEPYNPNIMEYTAYTLKDGEYFYYTNKDKLDIAYYGAGTKIKKTIYTPRIFKSRFDSEISAEEIATKGLSAAIPWRPYTLSASGGNPKKLTLTEYQYITLASGSTLSSFDTNGHAINNKWQTCTEAIYKIDGSESELPSVNLGDGINWEVRSKLELNVGPNLIQQLYGTNNAGANTCDKITITYNEDGSTKTIPIYPHNGVTLAIKANKLLQNTSDKINVGYTDITDTGSTATYYDSQIKVFELNDLRDINNAEVNLNNFGEGAYTKIAFGDGDSGQEHKPFASLYAIIPNETHFGLLMIQYNKLGSSELNTKAAIRIINSSGNNPDTTPAAPVIYNNNDSWWDTISTNNKLFATEGNNYSGCGEVKFAELAQTGTLYKRTSAPAPEPITNYALHDIEITSTGTIYYTYTGVTTEDTYDEHAHYCQLLNIGSDGDEGDDNGTLYTLKAGINVIKLAESGIVQIYPDQDHEDTVVISPLDLVYTTTGTMSSINPKLKYKIIDSDSYSSVEEQILADIAVLDPDHQFYYNALMNNETALDLNPNDPEDTLENPLNWYNYNNINNKFVVSEINAEYLTVGVTIARNSKL